MAIKRNAIPLLGKTVSDNLYKKIITSKVNDIYIALDQDAQKRAIEISHKFLNQGKRVFLVEMNDKDPSEMGFKTFTQHVQHSKELDLSTLMLHKLQLW